MNETSEAILEKFITKVASSAISIVLVGSHALGNTHRESDIDLIILTKHHRDTRMIQNVIKEFNIFESRPTIDCKMYTESEFSTARTGLENRFLWTCLSNGKVLFGEDIRNTVRLAPQRTSESFWKHVQSVEDACRNLGTGIQYTGSCYSIYDALSTNYFVDRFIFHSIEDDISKEESIKLQLGNEYTRVRERYYWIASRIKALHLQNKLRVPTDVDRKFNRKDYNLIYIRALDILELLHNKYKQIKHWSE